MTKKLRILIVDDEKDMVDLLTMRFESVGYEVEVASDGQEGLEKVRKNKPDLIILDVMMPKLDGYHMCRLLKFDSTYRDIPVLMLTARGQEHERETGMNVGADAYIVKPFDGKELLTTVERLLKKPV